MDFGKEDAQAAQPDPSMGSASPTASSYSGSSKSARPVSMMKVAPTNPMVTCIYTSQHQPWGTPRISLTVSKPCSQNVQSMLADGRISKEAAAELLSQLSPNPSPEKKKPRNASKTDMTDEPEDPQRKDLQLEVPCTIREGGG